MEQILGNLRPWLEMLPGQGEMEQLWFAVAVLGGLLSLILVYAFVKSLLYIIRTPKRRKVQREAESRNKAVLAAAQKLTSHSDASHPQGSTSGKAVARVQIFIDYANFDKNWVDNAYGLLAEGRQKVRLDWNKLTDVIMREAQGAVSSWQPELIYNGTFVQASVLPERFTTPRSYKLPKALAAQYYIYAKDPDLVRSKLDGKEYVAKKLHPAHVFLKFMMRKLPGYQVHISRRVIERNMDGSPVVMTSKSGIQYIKSGEKAVDSKVIADMTAGAMNDGYDIAVLLGSDTDFLPVIDTIQKGFNKPVIHFGFERGGHQVRAACWSHFVLDKALVTELREPPVTLAPQRVEASAVNEPTNIKSVTEKLADSTSQGGVKQVVQLFTPESLKSPQVPQPASVNDPAAAIKQDVAPLTAKIDGSAIGTTAKG